MRQYAVPSRIGCGYGGAVRPHEGPGAQPLEDFENSQIKALRMFNLASNSDILSRCFRIMSVAIIPNSQTDTEKRQEAKYPGLEIHIVLVQFKLVQFKLA